MKPVIKCIFLCVLLVFAYDRIWLLCKGATDGFTVARITGVLPYDARWESSTPLTEDVRAILHQKFTFLGSGGQCYAFASEDGRYVLKCFKSYRLKATTLLDKLLKKKRVKCKARLERDFTSYKLCFDQLAKESGILFVHLNATQNVQQKVTLIDKLGIAHELECDQLYFLIQKKAELVYPYITSLMKQGKVMESKQALHSILHLIVSRCKKGIYDEDAKIHRNFGFAETQALLIDVGRLKPDSHRTLPSIYKKEADVITRPLRRWLKNSYPELLSDFEQQLVSIE